jgi:caa(3)-type oxidase subunit IV
MLAMLAVIAMSDYLRLGPWLPWVQFAAAAVILTLLGFFWMNLHRASATVRIAAFVAIFFLFILAFLTFDDYLTRPVDLAPFQAPPSVPAPL